MGRAGSNRSEKVKAASFFMARAQEAMSAADAARTDEASAAFVKEAETWLYMASQCLSPEAATPPEAMLPLRRVERERRSFGAED